MVAASAWTWGGGVPVFANKNLARKLFLSPTPLSSKADHSSDLCPYKQDTERWPARALSPNSLPTISHYVCVKDT